MHISSTRYHLLWLILLPFLQLHAQTVYQDTTTRTAPIFYDVLGNQVEFRPEMPPLNQIAGAPQAYYTYYWEFGDGNYSFKGKPTHTYKEKGEYEVKLWSTNNYDNGKPPTSRPQNVIINSSPDQASLDSGPSLFPEGEDILIRTNRDPLPEEEMILITSYKNTKNYTTNGSIYLFYNDNHFKSNNFEIEDVRLHHGEEIGTAVPLFASTLEPNPTNTYVASTETLNIPRFNVQADTTKRTNLPNTLEESWKMYRDYQIIEFKDLKPGEERHIFRTLRTTPEMLKDTSAIVTLRTIYVPDSNHSDHTVKDTELEIVTSHDPNKMSTNATLMNYRLVRFKKVKFKVKFQNDGEGPASTIRLEVDTPDMFDKESLEILDLYPDCPICPKDREVNYSCLDTILKEDKIIFTFKKVYLPGTRQENVVDRDSTKGYVRYAMKFGDDFHKKKTRSRTAIYFDKNEPVITNYSATRFTPGISIGAKAGYIYTPSKDKKREVFAGVTVSPFKSYRGYWQSEFFMSASSFEDLKNFQTMDINDIGIESLQKFVEENKENNLTAYLVPISYRYNLNNFLAVGAGAQLQMDFINNVSSKTTGKAFLNIPGHGEVRDETNDSYQECECNKNFTNFNSGIFADVNIGGVRIGPSGGVRYVYNFREPHAQLQVYAIWKF